MSSHLRCLVVLFLAGSTVVAQPKTVTRSFEVASIKICPPTRMTLPGISISGLRFTATCKSVMALIQYAYNLRGYQIAHTQTLVSLDDDRYDISARAGGDVAPGTEEFRRMLQALLNDRFGMRLHVEKHEMPVYALVVGKKGPKFKLSVSDGDPVEQYTAEGRNYKVTMVNVTVSSVLTAIENSRIDRPVLDETGLAGTYDVKMHYTPNIKSNRGSEADPDTVDIFSALEIQLGLKLVSKQASVEMFMLDHIEKPQPN